MAGAEQLCDYCAPIPLCKDTLTQQLEPHFKLGSWSRIFASRCPLCRLVRHAYSQEYRTNSSLKTLPAGNVYLLWSNHTSFAITELRKQRICFAVPADASHNTASRCFNDLYPSVEAELDVSKVTRWVSECESTHGNECILGSEPFSKTFPGLRVLRLIDVQQNRLVEVQDCLPYVALSYVWGSVFNFRLTKSSLAQLRIPGAIRDAFEAMPKTIRDAITLCRSLKLRYLWVDALCLVQNDPGDLERGVNVMDRIYERSYLTVIAACGVDANAGLPGVHVGSRPSLELTTEIKPGIRMGVYTNLEQLLEQSTYNSRGWTFQEHALCRRALYFIDNKVFFRCRKAEFSECHVDQSYTMIPSYYDTTTHAAVPRLKFPPANYIGMIRDYSSRALTDQGDVLRAMAGIIRRVSGELRCKFIQGLPSDALDWFVIFRSGNCLLRRRPGFPSYSWCGWKGKTAIRHPAEEDRLFGSWIVWYMRHESGVTERLWDPTEGEKLPSEGALSYMKSMNRTQPEPLLPSDIGTTRTAPTKKPWPMPPYPVLQFWTLAVYLKLGRLDVFHGKARLEGKSGGTCGSISLDGVEETDFFSSTKVFEVALICKSYGRYSQGFGITYNVMLLEDKSGRVERRGTGFLSESKVEESFSPGHVWKEFILA